MNFKINKYVWFLLQFCLFFGLFYVLFCASVNMVIFPFAFGMLFALAWANQKVWLLAPAYVAAGILHSPTMESAISLLVTIFCLLAPYFAHLLAHKTMKKWEIALFAILSQTAEVVFCIIGSTPSTSSGSTFSAGTFSAANIFTGVGNISAGTLFSGTTFSSAGTLFSATNLLSGGTLNSATNLFSGTTLFSGINSLFASIPASVYAPIVAFASVLLGVLFCFACINVFEAIIIRGFSNKLTSLEIVCLFAIIGAVCGGLSAITVRGFSFLKLFMCLVVLFFAFCGTPLLTLLVASIGALGAMISTNNPIYFAPFIIWALAALLFKKRQKIFMVLAVLASELLIGFYFQLYAAFDVVAVLPVLCACGLFLLCPRKVLGEISTIFNLSKDRLAMKNVANRSREIMRRRLANLGEVFNEMNLVYRNLIKQGMTLEQVKEVLQTEIAEKICSFCPERNHCHRTHAQSTRQVFDQLIQISYEKGRCTVLDIPSYLTARCKQTAAILGSINALTAQYKKYMSMTQDVDTSKLIIADQLLGVSKIMGSLCADMEQNISFDTARENKILDELTYFNIICIDAVVFEKDIHTFVASVVVKAEDAEKPRIADVVSKVCGKKMAVFESFDSTRPGYVVLNLKTAPKYDCLFGVCQRTKNGSKVSGDTYSITKLDSDRLLFAISDGMGSGEAAERTSELSITLIENFYKAGFDNELILSTVNKLLALHKQDIFSAIDLCVLDQRSGIADFVKMAAPASYILGENACTRVESGALPVGVVEDCKPLCSKNCVSAKDFVILLSDGVADSFASEEELVATIKGIHTKNPQAFAEELISLAIACNNGYAVDDMTAIVIKVLDF